MTPSNFKALRLHDAILRSLLVSIPEGIVTVAVEPVGTPAFSLVFTRVTKVEAPRQQPWGPSASIGALHQPSASRFEFEMQSGDVIAIEAEQFTTAGSPSHAAP